MKYHLFSESCKHLLIRFGPGVALNLEFCVFKIKRHYRIVVNVGLLFTDMVKFYFPHL